MEENTKFYIFDKKEIALIFIFMLLVAIVAFILGVKFGLGYSYDSAGLSREDRQQIELLSTEEEQVNKLMQEKSVTPREKPQEDEDIKQQSVKKLKEEFDNLDSSVAPESVEAIEIDKSSIKETASPAVEKTVELGQSSDPLKGKITIRLASFRSLDDAKEFANGFKSRGYNTIISDKNLPSKGGIWYRVYWGF